MARECVNGEDNKQDGVVPIRPRETVDPVFVLE